MTLEELENSLPNGFHDAEVNCIGLNYVERTMTLELSVLIGDPDGETIEGREAFKKGRLVISGLQFAAIEAPDSTYPFSKRGAVKIDACETKNRVDSKLLSTFPAGAFIRSFFVSDWNAFIHVGGLSAEMYWNAPQTPFLHREAKS